MYYYHYYAEQLYDDVRLDMNVDNLGVNSQNVSLVCRMTEAGWYEFSVAAMEPGTCIRTRTGGYITTSNGGTTPSARGRRITTTAWFVPESNPPVREWEELRNSR